MLPLLFWVSHSVTQSSGKKPSLTLSVVDRQDLRLVNFSLGTLAMAVLHLTVDLIFPDLSLYGFRHGFFPMSLHGFPMVSHDFSMVAHWFSHWFSHGFSWFSMVLYVFPMVFPNGFAHLQNLHRKILCRSLKACPASYVALISKNSCRKDLLLWVLQYPGEYPRFMATCIYVAASTVWVKLMKRIHLRTVGGKCHQRCDQCSSVLAQDDERRRDAP